MTSNDIFVVGYGGWAIVHYEPDNSNYFDGTLQSSLKNIFLGGKMVQVTGASITRSLNLPLQNPYFLPFDGIGEVKSPIRVAFGTYSFNGDISFELTNGVANDIFNRHFYDRNGLFSLQFFDGQNTCTVRNCVWNSLGISCSPGGTVKVSISFQSNNGYEDDLQINSYNLNTMFEYDEDDLLVPYWQCGHEHFEEFNISLSRNVAPVYLNNDLKVPSYLRPGMVEIGLNATTIEYVDSWEDVFDIRIGKYHNIRLNGSVLKSSQYQMSSMADTGAKSYEWTSIADNPLNPIFTVT